jgi:hypothetical protein
MAQFPVTPLELVLSGLRTDADLLRRIIQLLPKEAHAERQTTLRQIESKIKELEKIQIVSLCSRN